MDAHPKEVVILSFSHFLGLNPELHGLLLTTLHNIFTSKLCPKTVRPVLPLFHDMRGCHLSPVCRLSDNHMSKEK